MKLCNLWNTTLQRLKKFYSSWNEKFHCSKWTNICLNWNFIMIVVFRHSVVFLLFSSKNLAIPQLRWAQTKLETLLNSQTLPNFIGASDLPLGRLILLRIWQCVCSLVRSEAWIFLLFVSKANTTGVTKKLFCEQVSAQFNKLNKLSSIISFLSQWGFRNFSARSNNHNKMLLEQIVWTLAWAWITTPQVIL